MAVLPGLQPWFVIEQYYFVNLFEGSSMTKHAWVFPGQGSQSVGMLADMA
ncbi:MAG: acyl transferase domain-containing protein, partial [Paraglaciecola sp.]